MKEIKKGKGENHEKEQNNLSIWHDIDHWIDCGNRLCDEEIRDG